MSKSIILPGDLKVWAQKPDDEDVVVIIPNDKHLRESLEEISLEGEVNESTFEAGSIEFAVKKDLWDVIINTCTADDGEAPYIFVENYWGGRIQKEEVNINVDTGMVTVSCVSWLEIFKDIKDLTADSNTGSLKELALEGKYYGEAGKIYRTGHFYPNIDDFVAHPYYDLGRKIVFLKENPYRGHNPSVIEGEKEVKGVLADGALCIETSDIPGVMVNCQVYNTLDVPYFDETGEYRFIVVLFLPTSSVLGTLTKEGSVNTKLKIQGTTVADGDFTISDMMPASRENVDYVRIICKETVSDATRHYLIVPVTFYTLEPYTFRFEIQERFTQQITLQDAVKFIAAKNSIVNTDIDINYTHSEQIGINKAVENLTVSTQTLRAKNVSDTCNPTSLKLWIASGGLRLWLQDKLGDFSTDSESEDSDDASSSFWTETLTTDISHSFDVIWKVEQVIEKNERLYVWNSGHSYDYVDPTTGTKTTKQSHWHSLVVLDVARMTNVGLLGREYWRKEIDTVTFMTIPLSGFLKKSFYNTARVWLHPNTGEFFPVHVYASYSKTTKKMSYYLQFSYLSGGNPQELRIRTFLIVEHTYTGGNEDYYGLMTLSFSGFGADLTSDDESYILAMNIIRNGALKSQIVNIDMSETFNQAGPGIVTNTNISLPHEFHKCSVSCGFTHALICPQNREGAFKSFNCFTSRYTNGGLQDILPGKKIGRSALFCRYEPGGDGNQDYWWTFEEKQEGNSIKIYLIAISESERIIKEQHLVGTYELSWIDKTKVLSNITSYANEAHSWNSLNDLYFTMLGDSSTNTNALYMDILRLGKNSNPFTLYNPDLADENTRSILEQLAQMATAWFRIKWDRSLLTFKYKGIYGEKINLSEIDDIIRDEFTYNPYASSEDTFEKIVMNDFSYPYKAKPNPEDTEFSVDCNFIKFVFQAEIIGKRWAEWLSKLDGHTTIQTEKINSKLIPGNYFRMFGSTYIITGVGIGFNEQTIEVTAKETSFFDGETPV